MKLFLAFLKGKHGALLAFLLFGGIFVGAFRLFQLPLSAMWYPLALCALLGLGMLAVEYRLTGKAHRQLQRAKKLPGALIGKLPSTRSVTERDCQQIIAALQGELQELETCYNARLRDRMEYYTVWAHQIKTPISAMKLILQGEDSPVTRQLSAELNHIEQYADMVMTFLRLEDGDSDYVFREYSLDSMIRQSVKRFSTEFIGRRIRLHYEPIDQRILTDEKWFCFVLEQLLSNALKYTREGSVTIRLEAPKTLCVEDTGMGIAPEDLPRIFEKGYTGYNGRIHKRATGIGLYLCARICERLGIGISARSAVGEGTRLLLDLEQQQLYTE